MHVPFGCFVLQIVTDVGYRHNFTTREDCKTKRAFSNVNCKDYECEANFSALARSRKLNVCITQSTRTR